MKGFPVLLIKRGRISHSFQRPRAEKLEGDVSTSPTVTTSHLPPPSLGCSEFPKQQETKGGGVLPPKTRDENPQLCGHAGKADVDRREQGFSSNLRREVEFWV